MRLLFLLISLLLPHLLAAQLTAKFSGPGSYVRAGRSTVRLTGDLAFDTRWLDVLTIKELSGFRANLAPEEVIFFRIGPKKFITLNQLITNDKYLFSDRPIFVELLDSGQVILIRHFTYQDVADTPNGNSIIGTAEHYLLRAPSDSLYHKATTRKQFSEALSPYLSARPDLSKVLAAHIPNDAITDNIPAIIHALNTGRPYAPPLSHYDRMKQAAEIRKTQRATIARDSTR